MVADTFSVKVTVPSERRHSERETIIQRIFGLSERAGDRCLVPEQTLSLRGLTYITGYSGSGKSCLLRAIAAKLQPTQLVEPDFQSSKSPIDSFDADVATVIQWLARFGLGEALVLTTPLCHLSVGQKERFRLSYLLWQKPRVILLDEFLSCVDRTTARIIAFQFQRIVRQENMICFVATAHDDLQDALFPDATLRLDFNGDGEWLAPVTGKRLPEAAEVQISEGDLADYAALKKYHYADQSEPLLKSEEIVSIRKATFRGKLIGVRVFTKLLPRSLERIPLIRQLNSTGILSARVVVHPVFRGLGLARRMDFDAEAARRSGADTGGIKRIFTHSAMAQYFPFDKSNGYEPTQHVSSLKSTWHDSYETLLKAYGITPAALHDLDYRRSIWQHLDLEQQGQLSNLVTKILVDYDLRYLSYLCHHLDIPLSATETAFFSKLFTAMTARQPVWENLSEALYFPMQGLVKAI